MESDIGKLQNMQTKIPPKNFSIESIVGIDRRSPEIDIENNISQDYTNSDDEVKRDRFFYQNRVNFPFFMSYDKRGYQEGQNQEDLKRASPGSIRSEIDSDGAEDRPHGEFCKHTLFK